MERYKEKYTREMKRIEDDNWTPGNTGIASVPFELTDFRLIINLLCRLEPSSKGAEATKEDN